MDSNKYKNIIVHEYIRKHQDIISIQIPKVIFDVIILFYSYFEWSIKNSNKLLKIDDNNII